MGEFGAVVHRARAQISQPAVCLAGWLIVRQTGRRIRPSIPRAGASALKQQEPPDDYLLPQPAESRVIIQEQLSIKMQNSLISPASRVFNSRAILSFHRSPCQRLANLLALEPPQPPVEGPLEAQQVFLAVASPPTVAPTWAEQWRPLDLHIHYFCPPTRIHFHSPAAARTLEVLRAASSSMATSNGPGG